MAKPFEAVSGTGHTKTEAWGRTTQNAKERGWDEFTVYEPQRPFIDGAVVEDLWVAIAVRLKPGMMSDA